MKKKKYYPILNKYKKPQYEFVGYDIDNWPLTINEVTVYYFWVDAVVGTTIRREIGITCYDSENEKSYSLNGIAKESTGYPFPYQAGICKKDEWGNFMDIEVIK
jgi:hypothetical protein